MIRYDLKCAQGHEFDSWFQSADAFEVLQTSGRLVCAVCNAGGIEKRIMAPTIRPARSAGQKPKLNDPRNEVEAAFADMRRHIEANSDYVGLNFAAEARRMHEGAIEERAIYGEAKADEARALVEDGIPVAPLPFIPKRQTN